MKINAIQDMVFSIEDCCAGSCRKCLENNSECTEYRICEQLYDNNYRKQSEVVKEIVERLRKEDAYFDDYHYDQLLDDIELDYGVELWQQKKCLKS